MQPIGKMVYLITEICLARKHSPVVFHYLLCDQACEHKQREREREHAAEGGLGIIMTLWNHSSIQALIRLATERPRGLVDLLSGFDRVGILSCRP